MAFLCHWILKACGILWMSFKKSNQSQKTTNRTNFLLKNRDMLLCWGCWWLYTIMSFTSEHLQTLKEHVGVMSRMNKNLWFNMNLTQQESTSTVKFPSCNIILVQWCVNCLSEGLLLFSHLPVRMSTFT